MKIKILIIIAMLVTLSGCATTHTHNAPQYLPVSTVQPVVQTIQTSSAAVLGHVVKPGETLWGISKTYDVDLDALVKANSISDGRTIEKGQILIIPGAVKPKKVSNYAPANRDKFTWPVKGSIISQFGSKIDKGINKGIDIRAVEGTGVKASRGGKVVYCDSHMKGFGKTVIVDHFDNFQTVYSYNSDILVKVGDMVRQNDIIAKVGSSGRAKEPALHFEIRKDGQSQNPVYYLSK